MSRGSIDRQLEEILIDVERRRRRRRLLLRLAALCLQLPHLLRRSTRFLRRPSSPGELMLLSLGLLVVAVILRGLVPSVGLPLLWVGVILFFTAFVTFFLKPDIDIYQRKWRGQVIETRRTSWWERLYRWLYRG